jgi:glutamyl-tRNA synthetase
MVVTRIAPSPTGDPHVGTAYQALFDYVWARKNGGRFVVRIEDTDQSRYRAESEERILATLRWLGLNYDEAPDVGGPHAPYRQSERLHLYRQYADQLVAQGHAYRAFETPAELEAIRAELKASGYPLGYDGRARQLPLEEAQQRAQDGQPHVVRLKAPRQGQTTLHDQFRGPIQFDNQGVEDAVLLKTDGFPTYHLAVVVDDHLMQVSDVVRGEEWLPSAPLHVLLYQFLGWEQPRWYHMPLLQNPDKTKLSKRKGNTSIDWYRDQGILAEALINYLGLMGWSMPDGREIFTLEEMVSQFDWGRMSLGGSVFGWDKLKWLNGKYIREVLSSDQLAERIEPFLHQAGLSSPSRAYLIQVVEAMRARFETLQEFVEKSGYFFSENYPFSEKATAKLAEGAALILPLHEELNQLPNFLPDQTEPLLKQFAESRGLKLAAVMQPLRAALTGSLETPGMFELLFLLGRERVLDRLQRVAQAAIG